MDNLKRPAAFITISIVWASAAVLLLRTKVPGDLHLPHLDPRTYFGAAELARADRYERVARWLYVGRVLAQLAALAVLARFGRPLAAAFPVGRIGRGVLAGIAAAAVLWIVQLPFGLVGLWWDRRYGLSKEGYAGWLAGSWGGLYGTVLLVTIGVALALGLAGYFPRDWWAVATPAIFVVAVAFAFVTPYLIFGTHPLPGARRAEFRALAAREGVAGTPGLVEDVGGRTTEANAFSVGIGPSRRVVFWSTILDGRFGPGELRVVTAHELGHVARDHIWKGLGWFALFTLPTLWIVAAATRRRGGLADPGALLLALLVLFVVQLALTPGESAISRRYESEADWLALQTTRDPRSAERLFEDFGRTSLQQPSPPTWDYVWLEDHPTLLQRIAMAEAWRRRQTRR